MATEAFGCANFARGPWDGGGMEAGFTLQVLK